MHHPIRFSFLVLALIAVALVGCGGGGGGGAAGPSGPAYAYVGTVPFDPATSRGLGDHPMGFALPVTWTFSACTSDPGSSPAHVAHDQTFVLATLVVGGVSVPCYRTDLQNADPNFTMYEWWACAVDGGLYRLTRGRYDYAPGADDGVRNNDPNAPILLSQAKLILPAGLSAGVSWSGGSTPTLDTTMASAGHQGTRTVVSTSATSPHGFPGCTKIQHDFPASGSGPTCLFEYWLPGQGVVEIEVPSSATTIYNFRDDISASG